MEYKFLILILIVNQVLGLGVKSDDRSQSHVALDDAILSLFKRNPLDESPRIANIMYHHGMLPRDDFLMQATVPPAVISQPPAETKSILNDTSDAEISLWLSKMSDEQLLDLLREKPDKKEYNIEDLMAVITSQKGTANQKESIPEEIQKLMKIGKDVTVVDQLIPFNAPYQTPLPHPNYEHLPKPHAKYDFMTGPKVLSEKFSDHNENYNYIDSNKDRFSDQRDLLKENLALRVMLDKIVQSQIQETIAPDQHVINLHENMENFPPGIISPREQSYSKANLETLDYNLQKDKELLFDALVGTLRMLCCSPNNKGPGDVVHNSHTAMLGSLPPFMQWASKHKIMKDNKPEIYRRNNDEQEQSKPQEQLFLVLNEELPSNGTDGIVMVDPDSLSSNSTILPLGPVTDDLNDADLKTVMNKVSNELRKTEYKELISQLSEGINNRAVPGQLMLDSEVTRRYFRPHRCHHRSQLSRVSGGTKWLVCTGYIGFNKPSVYDG